MIKLDDFDQVGINPCTGQEVIVSFSDMKAVRRSGSWTADDYSGRFRQSVVANFFDVEGGDFVFAKFMVARGSGPEGRPMTRYRAHLRVIDGVPEVAIVEFDARCVA